MTAAKVLLIDDDADFVHIHKAYLEAAGFTVVSASDGDEGLAMARQESPDVVVLDYMMTRPTEGSVVAIEMKEDPQLKNIPIVLLTSVRAKHPWWGVHKDESYLPVDSLLDKPVSGERLVDEIRRLVEKNR